MRLPSGIPGGSVRTTEGLDSHGSGKLLDGHNRYRILKKHPEIPFKTFPKEFPDKYAAIAWICRNQLGRRNLTPEQKRYLVGKQYKAEKASHGAEGGFRGNQYTEVVVST